MMVKSAMICCGLLRTKHVSEQGFELISRTLTRDSRTSMFWCDWVAKTLCFVVVVVRWDCFIFLCNAAALCYHMLTIFL